MLRENEFIRVIVIYRTEVRPFTDQRIWRWCRILPHKPSSQSKTRGCSTNCGSRWSDEKKPRLLMYSRLISRTTFDLQTILDSLLKWAGRLAKQTTHLFSCEKVTFIVALPAAATYPNG